MQPCGRTQLGECHCFVPQSGRCLTHSLEATTFSDRLSLSRTSLQSISAPMPVQSLGRTMMFEPPGDTIETRGNLKDL